MKTLLRTGDFISGLSQIDAIFNSMKENERPLFEANRYGGYLTDCATIRRDCTLEELNKSEPSVFLIEYIATMTGKLIGYTVYADMLPVVGQIVCGNYIFDNREELEDALKFAPAARALVNQPIYCRNLKVGTVSYKYEITDKKRDYSWTENAFIVDWRAGCPR